MPIETTAASQRPDSPGVRFMPPFVFYPCILMGPALGFLLPEPAIPLPPTVCAILGIALFAGGFVFMMWGHNRFTSLGVNVKTVLPASMLVTGGAYRYSRNPMYVGMVALLAGAGAVPGGLWGLLGALVMALYLTLVVVPREESYLRRAFGAEYETYLRAVRRWL